MTDYKVLAIRYLQNNKKRSISTIIGVMLATIAVFGFLNTFLEFFTTNRDREREAADYDIVVFVENDEQIAEIISYDFVKDAYLGSYTDEYVDNGTLYENVLYITDMNPYSMGEDKDFIEETYGVQARLNEVMADYYFQSDDSYAMILILMSLLISVIMAFVGVGIIRNSIQLFSLEQIKDYGVLRCIGATKKQLKTHIYIMGCVLEAIGVIAGIAVGFIISVIIAVAFNINIGLHLLAVAFVVVAFLGDLIFVMRENVKFIDKLTPVEAVRGEYKGKKEKIKKRGRSLFGLIFGFEGEYAYKNLMRDKARFGKTVATITLGVTGIITVAAISQNITRFAKVLTEKYGDNHQVQVYITPSILHDLESAQASLPPMDKINTLLKSKYVSDAKLMYNTSVYPTDTWAYFDKVDSDYLENSQTASWKYEGIKDMREEGAFIRSSAVLFGYDEDEYKQLDDVLIAGTTDLSENGVIVVQGQKDYEKVEDDELASDIVYFKTNNYEIGDEIVLFDVKRQSELFTEANRLSYEEKYRNDDGYGNGLVLNWLEENKQKMLDEGAYKTYVVEGIVKENLDPMNENLVSFIVPLDRYFEETGYSEDDISGVKCHYSGTKLDDNVRAFISACSSDDVYAEFDYFIVLEGTRALRITVAIIIGIIVFLFALSSINIVNTTSSNLHIRRKELAQLRVLGMSKKRVFYTVILEGVITGIVSNILGGILGFVFAAFFMWAESLFMGGGMTFPFVPAIISLLISVLILALSYYMPIRNMRNDMASDLMASGD